MKLEAETCDSVQKRKKNIDQNICVTFFNIPTRNTKKKLRN